MIPAADTEVTGLLDRLRLAEQGRTRAAELSHGQQQWLEIGVALMARPRLLLLDEPTAGMSPRETAATAELLRELTGGTTTVIVEHDLAFVRRIADIITVMHRGQAVAEGSPDEIAQNRAGARRLSGAEDAVTLLAVDDVYLRYGPSPIVQGVSLTVDTGEVVALLGRNGVGKTTLARGLVGLMPIASGHVRIDGADVTGMSAHRVSRRGVRIVPQGRGIFPRLSVAENLRIGAFLSQESDPRVRDLLHEVFPILWERRQQRAGTLSGGEQQMLAIARALVSAPKLLILDEPTEGVAPVLIDRIEDALRLLFAEMRLGVLLIEQNLDFAFAMAQRGYVMEKGQIVLEAPIADLRHDAVERYLTF